MQKIVLNLVKFFNFWAKIVSSMAVLLEMRIANVNNCAAFVERSVSALESICFDEIATMQRYLSFNFPQTSSSLIRSGVGAHMGSQRGSLSKTGFEQKKPVFSRKGESFIHFSGKFLIFYQFVDIQLLRLNIPRKILILHTNIGS